MDQPMTYEQARREAEDALVWKDGLPLTDHYCAVVTVRSLRALLAGPPEPTEEEVARVLQPGLFSDDPKERHRYASPYKVEVMQERALVEARRIQQLYRSRHG